METGLILFGVAVVIIFVIICGVLARYRRCPSDKIMVIYGKVGGNQSAECIHGGAAFVWPIFQDYQYLDLTPFSINIDLRGALSKQNIRVDVPSSFTVAISTEHNVMQMAAERLLGLDLRTVQNLASEIILGQLRLIVAQMDVEELNTQRERFMEEVSKNVESELKKIGLKLINANITDIRDESNYIEALGKKAEAAAINDAKVQVAELNRRGNTLEAEHKAQEMIGIKEQERVKRVGIAESDAQAVAAEKEAEKALRTAVARTNAETIAAEKEAEMRQRAAVAEANAQSIAAEKEAEMKVRAATAARDADAKAAENQALANIAMSDAKRREAEAEAAARAYTAEKVQNAQALSAAYSAEEKAEQARAARQKATMEADVLVQAEIERKRVEIAAEAEAEAIRRRAKGHADALLTKMQAEADGYKAQLAKRAEGFTMLVRAANNDPKSAVNLMMTDKIEELLKIQVEAIKNINIDKVTVWDFMGGKDGSSTTSNFLSSMMKSIPPMKDVFDMVGMEMPANLGKDKETVAPATSVAAKPSIVSSKSISA